MVVPLEVGSLSHYLHGFIHPNGGCLGFLKHQLVDPTFAQVISSPWRVQKSLYAAVVIHASNVDMACMEADNGGLGPS